MDKFPSAVFKKFASEQDAWAFVRSAQSQSAAPSYGGAKGNMKGVRFKMAGSPYKDLPLCIVKFSGVFRTVYKTGLRCHHMY